VDISNMKIGRSDVNILFHANDKIHGWLLPIQELHRTAAHFRTFS